MTAITALAGGVGGAKLAHGLAMSEQDDQLTVIVNTADDFTLYGLHISPDLDTVMYTLGGLANFETGWGVAGDTSVALDMLRRYGEDTWFWLGDKDLATHVLRTAALRSGERLTTVTQRLSQGLGIQARIIPMTDEPVATQLETPAGILEFQDYFVRRHHTDEVTGVRLKGIERATITDDIQSAISEAGVIILCPSNPIVSIGPILAVPGFRDLLRSHNAPVVAVSPIIGGLALKGPADQMMQSLGYESSAVAVARLYSDLLSGIVIDTQDEALSGAIGELGIEVLVTDTIMKDLDDRQRLARETVDFARALSGRTELA